MYVKKTKCSNGRTYLALAQGYRKDGKAKSRTVESLGYLDELEKIYADPIAHFKAICEKHNKEIEDNTAPQTITIHPAQKIDKRETNRKNIGCALALYHYNTLGIEKTLRNATKDSRAVYDINAILRLLVCERITDPGSKLAAHANKDKYFFKCDFTDDDIYRSLDVLAKNKSKIIAAMNRSIEKSGRRNMDHVFYDVTNHYFDIDHEDDLRRYGVEKNRRRDPIVQMGLLQDSNAIPITYQVFPGNTNDAVTLLPVLREVKEDFGLNRVIVVADKGLNSSDNIAANILDGNGYVFSQSIRGTKSSKELRKWVLEESGYSENDSATFKIKSRQDTKVLSIEGSDGKVKKVSVDIKVVAYWSAKYAERSRHKRAEAIEKAKKLIADPSRFSKATSYGAAKYISNITFDKKTGEILTDAGKHPILNEDAIRRDEDCDGYYCLITSETHLPDEEIIDIYKGLWRIEEAFRISKTDLSTRPIFVWTPEHIEAHFLTCYIALTILRLLQLDTDFKYSAASIIEEISSMAGSREEDNWWLFDHRTDISDELCESVGIDLTRKRMQLTEIKKVLSQVNKK